MNQKMNHKSVKEQIYDLMNGYINLQDYPQQELQYATNEYEDGKYCAVLYEQILSAYGNVCDKYNIPNHEDSSIELIINNLMEICRYQCMKMYDYGFNEASDKC